MATIGSQDGIKAAINRLRDLDPGGTSLQKGPSGWPDISTLTIPLDQWKAYDKLQRTIQILKDDHDGVNPKPPEPQPPEPAPAEKLSTVRARIFLANHPLDCVNAGAPRWLIPVVTADPGYREWYPPDTIQTLRSYFNVNGLVEAWCDCRASGGTPYSAAVQMVKDLNLDGPAWGQCETQPEFDHAYSSGARRMVGNLSALNDASLNRIKSGEVLVTNELYRNVQPWQQPDWRGCQDGVGGNTIACYASSTEGAAYMSVQTYKNDGMYVSKNDSVYGVGLKPEDWRNL